MKIETLLTEAEITDEFSESLEARDLPEKFFYWSPHSVRAWLARAQDIAYESCQQAWNLLINDTSELAGQFDSQVALVSLGAGSGAKDVALCQALRSANLDVEYFPIDASQALLEGACASAEEEDLDTWGIKADISSPVHLVLALDATELPRLLMVAGNTLGGQDPLDLIRNVAANMRQQDRLLIDAEIHDDSTLPSWENPLGARFANAPLLSFGITPEAGSVHFELKRDDRRDGLYLVTRHFHTSRDLRVSVAGKDIAIQRGERINLNFDYTYTPEAVRWLLTERAGLEILEEIESPDGRYRIALCSR